MATKKTVEYFRILIFLECFLCINRSYLIDDKILKTICDIVYFGVSFTAACVTFYGNFSDPEINFNLLAFQGLISLELLGLTIFSRSFTKQYIALQKLDNKFGLDENYIKILKSKANVAAVTTVVSMIIDICGITLLSAKPVMVMFCLGAAAHDAELAFFSLFINVINIRLAKSITVNPSFGSSVYRHVLIATSYFNEGFQFGIQLMWLVTLLTTIIYGFVVAMMNYNKSNTMVCYIAWRELKSLYSLWVVCIAAYRTEGIYQRLKFHLTTEVVLNPKIATDKPSKSQQTLHRWYTSVLSQKPRFTTSQSIPITLNIPVVMLDVSINYLLLVIQFYTAYK